MGLAAQSPLALATLAFALVGLTPGAAGAAGTHTAADWFANCAGQFPLGDSDVGTDSASIDWSGPLDGATGEVLGAGISFGSNSSASYEGSIRYTGTGPLAGACDLSAGVISAQQYSIRNLVDPLATTAELDITFEITGRFQASALADFSLGGARFGLDLYLPTDPGDPLNGPRTPVGNLFCQTAISSPLECSSTGAMNFNDLQTLIVSDGVIFDGTARVRFDFPISDALTIGVTTFSGLSLDAGIGGPVELRSDFGDTVTWQISATDSNVEVLPVPEPGAGALLGIGLLGLARARRRQGRRRGVQP